MKDKYEQTRSNSNEGNRHNRNLRKKEHTVWIVDFMALIHTITKYLIRSKDLRGKWYLIFQRVTVVSILLLISTSERLKRGISTKVIVNI